MDGITVKPIDKISITTSQPMKSPLKTNKTIGGEVQIISDKRFRRLIPYMSYYYPGNDFNYPVDFMPMVRIHFMLLEFLKLFISFVTLNGARHNWVNF